MSSFSSLSHTGACPECGKVLAVNVSAGIIECPACGSRHSTTSLKNFQQLDESFLAYYKLLRSKLSASTKDTGPTKVQGISGYECKILGPHLTTHGMDKAGNPKPISELAKHDEFFNCSSLGDRSFVIEKELLDKAGYGIDQYSLRYLSEMLSLVDGVNNRKQCLVPLHADGDGHCLVHAVSRCLVGRELFWHALRTNIYNHMKTHRDRYEAVYSNFFDSSDGEWERIVAEAHPDYRPPANSTDGHGLCVIHIFALANVLRRPILLLDGMEGLKSKCEYTGTYLPILYPPEECCGRNKQLNKPIAVAWSSASHHHYVPLVAVQGASSVKLPGELLPQVAITDPAELTRYVHLEDDGGVILGGERCLSDNYIVKLTAAMRTLFYEAHQVRT